MIAAKKLSGSQRTTDERYSIVEAQGPVDIARRDSDSRLAPLLGWLDILLGRKVSNSVGVVGSHNAIQ